MRQGSSLTLDFVASIVVSRHIFLFGVDHAAHGILLEQTNTLTSESLPLLAPPGIANTIGGDE